jgi:hypothetical protein
MNFNLHLHLSVPRKEVTQHRITCLSRCFVHRHNDWADNALIITHSWYSSPQSFNINCKYLESEEWDITPCSPLKVNWSFGGTWRLNLQGRKNKASSAYRLLSCRLLVLLILRPWRRMRPVLPKRRLTVNGLHGVTAQKIELFITTGVRTSFKSYIFQDCSAMGTV